MSGYECCCLYRSLKFHFTSNYDFEKYNGRIKYTNDQFESNSHRHSYIKIAKKYNTYDELKGFFISNFIELNTIWVQDLCTQESFDIFSKYIKRVQSLSYIFKTDLLNIFDVEDKESIFKVTENEFPYLLTKLFRNEISLETVVILNEFLKFIPRWDKQIKDDFIWPNIKMKVFKYEPFIDYDKIKFKKILLDVIQETS